MFIKKILAAQTNGIKQKITIFVLLPTFVILVSIGGIGMQLVRQVLLDQWQETAITKLQRAAHYIDMRLMRPKEVLRFLQKTYPENLHRDEMNLLLEQLRSMDGVMQVNQKDYDRLNVPPKEDDPAASMQHAGISKLHPLSISMPSYNSTFMSETISIFAPIVDKQGKTVQYIEVVLSFYDLVDQIVKSPWWKSNQAFIIDSERNILASTTPGNMKQNRFHPTKFGQKNALEEKTWQAMQKSSSGTVFGPGMPPDKISGYYRLSEAPWDLVLIAPGEHVLQPILEFRIHYYLLVGFGILITLIYIRLVTDKATRAINRLATAADELANGTFTTPLAVDRKDEIGALTTSFNIMTKHLEERLQLRKAMNLARDVQQNLLPQKGFTSDGIEVAGLTLYCEATGGDYVDMFRFSQGDQKIGVIVGDVVGHGIGAALLMATVRALFRGRACLQGPPAEVVQDVNRLLCMDTSHSGNFVTMFYLEVDRTNRRVKWVRCGHEPAIVYFPENKSFSELKGPGTVLGFDVSCSYFENSCNLSDSEQLILIGSDGAWDAENDQGERFGRDRVKALIARYHHLPAEKIIRKITEHISDFQAGHKQDDDITLALVKIW